ncbi:hypothetical protein JTB14_004545 [Gonioctena quinquepunctata]|nr:hypothetical protein JTB14_004545 [Gonioctena quinquepunctata]
MGNSGPRKIDRQRLPNFSGLDTEDPIAFIDKMIYELRKCEIPNDETQLRGEAQTWANNYSTISIRWEFFLNQLLSRYNNEEVLSRLTSKFFGKAQGSSERVDIFIAEKIALANRLMPNIVQLLLPSIKPYLRGVVIYDIEQLMLLASGIESDISTARPSTGNSGPMQRNIQNNSAARNMNTNSNSNHSSQVDMGNRNNQSVGSSNYQAQGAGNFSANSNIYRPPMMARNFDNQNVQSRSNTFPREEIPPRQNNTNRETNVNRAKSSDRHNGFQSRNTN